jgi:hypothetical protein
MKMIAADYAHIPISATLIVVASVVLVSIMASIVFPGQQEERT